MTRHVSHALVSEGLVQIEVSARHVHLTAQAADVLFGCTLTESRPLSQPGQFLSEQRVILVGPKSRLERVAVLGPERPSCQVEISRSDAVALGVKAPVRESGDVARSGSITLVGPCGQLTLSEGVIVAMRHIHVTPDVAEPLCLQDKQLVQVRALTERSVTFNDVLIRVSPSFRFRMHIDFDEANAALVEGFTLGKIEA